MMFCMPEELKGQGEAKEHAICLFNIFIGNQQGKQQTNIINNADTPFHKTK